MRQIDDVTAAATGKRYGCGWSPRGVGGRDVFFFERDVCQLIPCGFVWNFCFLWVFLTGGLAHDFGEETVG